MKRRKVEVFVSDHAVLRWLEREHGLDVAAIKALLGGAVASAAELGAVALCTGKVRLVLAERAAVDTPVGRVVVVTALKREDGFSPDLVALGHEP